MATAVWLSSLLWLPPAFAEAPPVLKVPPIVELGLLAPGAMRPFAIPVSNASTHRLRLQVEPACGCMEGERIKDLPAQGGAEILLVLDASQLPHGPFQRTVQLQAEGRAPTRVTVRGEVGCIMRPSKGELRIEGIRRNKDIPSGATLLLEGREGAAIRPLLRKPLEPHFQVKFREITDSAWELALFLKPELLPPGELTGGGQILLEDAHNGQELEIPVLWVRARPIQFSPDPLVVRGAPGQPFQVSVRLNQAPGVSIRAVSVDHHGMRLEQRGEPGTWVLMGRIPEAGVVAAYLVAALEDLDDPEASLRILVRADPPSGLATAPVR